MKNAMRVLALASLLLLVGCATMSEEECRFADWYLLGLEDGRDGRPTEYLQNRQQACFENNIAVDADSWARGHAEGLESYCTPTRGWREGSDGGTYRYACPAKLEPAFLQAYDAGQRYYHASQALNRLENEIEDMEDELVADETTKDQRRTLLGRITAARADIKAHRAELYAIESEARSMGWSNY
jgi:hypothetical protein